MVNLPKMMMMMVLWFGCALASNWAVLVSTSNAWHDYRHSSNVMAIYQEIRRLGVPEEQIILMTAGSFQCDSRNINVASQMVNTDLGHNVLPDYKGREVTPGTLYKVLANRGARKALKSNQESNILIYLTGHGTDGVLGFQDSSTDNLSAEALNAMLHEMWVGGRYKSALVMVDSCQSETMIDGLDAPNVSGIASARRGRPSYSTPREETMGISLIDEFSQSTAQFLASLEPQAVLSDLAKWHAKRNIQIAVRGEPSTSLGRFFKPLNTITT